MFRPISDTWLLARTLRDQGLAEGASVLDLCTGSGAVAVSAALVGVRDVIAVDVSRRAILTARLNARLNAVTIRTLRSDLFAGLTGQRFHVIVSNPPYVPDPSGDRLPTRGPRRAWDAGRDGRVLLERLIAEAPAHLHPSGTLLVVHSEICGTQATLDAMHAAGLEAGVVARQRGPLGPLMRQRLQHLRNLGTLGPGQDDEEVVVIAGTRRATVPRDHRPVQATA